MKYSLIIRFSVLLLVVTGSCSESFLEKVPEGQITTGSFYQTEEQFRQAVLGIYSAVRSAKGSTAAWTMAEMRADNTYYEYNVNNRGLDYQYREDIDGFLDDDANTHVGANYNAYYVSIARANAVLENIERADLSAEFKNWVTGQARFLRALLYFDLVRYYGGVPLYLKPVSAAADAYLPRASADSVYQAIVGDLTDAITKLPSATFPQDGYASKGSAQMALGDVYLTLKQYAAAEQPLLAVTQAGYRLLDHYADVYELENKNSRESIFELQYQEGNQGQHSNFVYPFLPLADDVSLITGIISQNRNGGGWNVPTQAFIKSYETGDQRLDASIGIAEGNGPVGAMVINAVYSPSTYSNPEGRRTYAFIRKFLHAHSLENNTDDNFPVYRYAEALLALAEVQNELGKSAEARESLNLVRRRAGLPDSEQTSQEGLREAIFQERRVELAFENKRWFDLIRTDRAIEVMKAHGDYIKSLDGHLLPQSYQITRERLLYAIPQREILIGGLEQNPGY